MKKAKIVKTKLTPDEFATKTLELRERSLNVQDWTYTAEDFHREVDAMMLRILRENGFEIGANIFSNTPVWYS